MSHDAYAKFIEDDFLGGARINPRTDGRPDPRPDVRENAAQLGNLMRDFGFSQRPLPPMILRPYPAAAVRPGLRTISSTRAGSGLLSAPWGGATRFARSARLKNRTPAATRFTD